MLFFHEHCISAVIHTDSLLKATNQENWYVPHRGHRMPLKWTQFFTFNILLTTDGFCQILPIAGLLSADIIVLRKVY